MVSKSMLRWASKQFHAAATELRVRSRPTGLATLEVAIPSVESLLRTFKRFKWAYDTNSSTSQSHLARTVHRAARNVGERVLSSAEEMRTFRVSPPLSESSIYGDLVALDKLYGGTMKVNRDLGYVSVTTAPITLTDGGMDRDHSKDTVLPIAFGRFEMRLFMGRVADNPDVHAFHMRALEPVPSTPDPLCTHPNVRAGVLCAGAGDLPLRLALRDGRLMDAFSICQSTLETYGYSSPFVRLCNWLSVPCANCGGFYQPARVIKCTGCAANVCERCRMVCYSCGSATSCKACVHKTPGGRLCTACGKPCSRCKAVVQATSTFTLQGDKPVCVKCRVETIGVPPLPALFLPASMRYVAPKAPVDTFGSVGGVLSEGDKVKAKPRPFGSAPSPGALRPAHAILTNGTDRTEALLSSVALIIGQLGEPGIIGLPTEVLDAAFGATGSTVDVDLHVPETHAEDLHGLAALPDEVDEDDEDDDRDAGFADDREDE